MRTLTTLITAASAGLLLGQSALAQPRPYDQPGHPQYQSQRQQMQGGQYYYNGRWVNSQEWQRHNSERDRWARNYDRRRGHRDHGDDNDTSTALVAGIIGFALGAAIVGSQQQAEHARTADSSWDAYCARKYRSYDRHSRTYMGVDGVRHYCQ